MATMVLAATYNSARFYSTCSIAALEERGVRPGRTYHVISALPISQNSDCLNKHHKINFMIKLELTGCSSLRGSQYEYLLFYSHARNDTLQCSS